MTEKERLLVEGAHRLYAWHNVACGTPGYWINQLARDGLLTETVKFGVLPEETSYHYRLTERGRAARLALLGVTEA